MLKLSELIRNWESTSGFSISTLEKAKEGKPVKSITARLIAKALGCSDTEAKAFADQAGHASEETPDEAKETA